jgi:hypothetical protein
VMYLDYCFSRVVTETSGDEERIYKEQDRQCTYNAILVLRRVRATFAVEK